MIEPQQIHCKGGTPSSPTWGIAVLAFLMAALFLTSSARAQNTITNIMSPVVSYQYYDSVAEDTNSPITSPVVSYQFYDSLTDMGTNSVIMSPVASYQYFDWPGTADLQLVNSPSVSFFYESAALTSTPQAFWGVVTDTKGVPIANATITLSILSASAATAQTGLDGSYSLPAVAPGIYELSATLSGFVADQRVVSLNSATAQQNFLLISLPAPPQITTAGSTPPIAQAPDDIQGAHLVVFDGEAFQSSLAPDPSKMTVVLTHGWVQSSAPGFPEWPTDMALAMKTEGVLAFANIVAWDWHQAATTPLDPPWWKTYDQGTNLGNTLYQELGGSGYSMPIHFIGHSLGTMVNAEAANFLTGHSAGNEPVAPKGLNPQNIHLTLLDEGELGQEALQLLEKAVSSGFATGPLASFVEPTYYSPIPQQWQDYAWIDNYISAFGLLHNEAVSVYLPEAANSFVPTDLFDSALAMHGYSCNWYEGTIRNPTASGMGFINSFESQRLGLGIVFPPEELDEENTSGYGFEQDENPNNQLEVQSVPTPPPSWNAPFLPLAAPSGLLFLPEAAFSLVTFPANAMLSGTFNVEVAVVQRTTVAADDAFNFLSSQFSQAVVDLGNQPQVLLALTTAAAAKPQTPPPGGGSNPSNIPACVWMPLSVPANASELIFNFTASGDCAQDSLVFGVNSNSVFSVALAYLTAGQTYSSGPIDISAYADSSTNQFFFGVLGGTSTDATVDLEDIQFVSFALPSLSIAQANGTTSLSWPSSANGYALQSTVDLSVGSWEDVTNVPSLFGGVFTVTNSWPDQTRFFRLH